MATTNDLKNGLVLNLDGQLWTVTAFQHVKPGKGGAFVRTTLKNVLTGKVVDQTFNAGTKVDTATVDRRDMTFLYRDGSDFVFMDGDTYDQIPIPEVTVGDAANYLLENQKAMVALARRRAALHRAAHVGRAGDLPHRPRPAGRPLHRRHEAGHAGDRRRDPGARCSSPPARRSRSTPATAGTSAACPEPCACPEPARRRASAHSTSSSSPRRAATTRWRFWRSAARPTTPRRSRTTRRCWSKGSSRTANGSTSCSPSTRRAGRSTGCPPSTATCCGSAVFELLWVDEIDDPVAITEAVELARTLSTDDSPRFLNGVLAGSPTSPSTCAPPADAAGVQTSVGRNTPARHPLIRTATEPTSRGRRFDSMTGLPWKRCVLRSSPWPSGRSRSA